uniref:Uncharacterized protein n=1 Tax=Culex quinquefasciatus TaxID=7176 RepID=A0A1S4JW08_CULQU
MMQSSTTKSPTITVFRLRSDRTMLGSYIPLVFPPGRVAGCEEDRLFKTHATTTNTTTITTVNGTASGARDTEVATTNKSDYIYLTQSTDSRALLVTRFPLDDLGASRALVGHITELMRTTNSVTLKCDLNAYLNNVSISRNLALVQCTTLSRKVPTVAAVRENRCGGGGSYIRFDDLLAMVAGEKALLKRRSALESQGRVLPRLRLCGGGEDSINNGTSAWGTPPTSANNTSAWGIPNQQQQQQQPPQAWGGTASNNSANNNNNNNNQPTSSQSQRQSSQQSQQDHNANKAPQQGSGSAPNGGGTSNPWNRNPTQQQQQQQQPQPPGPNPNQQQPPQQQQQQPQLVMGNNGNVATKSQLEQLSHLRDALFSQDGWGCQNVNQDTNWEVPGSPEPPKPEPSSASGGGNGGPNPPVVTGWKPCNLNNGTELWEANLRNGGQPPPPQAPVQKTPWGPASNIGGTWGEDDDSGEANVWNGAAGGNPPAAAPPAWNQNNPPMWPPGAPGAGPNPAAVKKDNDWAGVGVIGNAGAAAVPPPVSGWDSRGAPVPPVNVPPGPIGQTNPIEAIREIRGDPRGISGRLNGNAGMWDQQNVPNLPTAAKLAQGSLPSVGGGANSQWNTPVPNKMPGGWDDSPAPMNNRPTLDDGPSGLWNQGQLSRQNSNVSSWKDMSADNVVRTPMPRTPLGGGANLPLGPAVSRGVRLGGMNPGMKPDSSMWGQNQGLPPMNGSWDDCAGAGGINNWDDKGLGAAGGNGPWNDFGQSNLWKQQGKPSVGGWPDPSDLMGGGSGNDWNMNKPPSKMSPVEIIRSSKQYRMLCENGFKKEDVELVLRTTNMNFDESLEILQRHNSAGDWRGRPDEHPGSAFEAPFSNRFQAGPGGGMPFSQNLLNNLPGVGGPNPNLAALNNLKYLSQGGAGGHSSFGSQPGGGGPNPLTAAASSQQNQQAQQPSTQHLRMLVQQIQMAVHAGFLNHQILNQPLAPQTLLLLNQLLTNIRQMQHIQNNLARSGGATGVSTVQLTMQINKHKSTISQLQQQIAAQQAIYVKQQQQQQQPGGGPHGQPPNVGLGGGAADFLRQQDLVSLQNNFADMGMGKEPVTPTGGFPAAGGNVGGGPGVTSQQSRLNQWKLPSLDKDGGGGANDLTDFSRAPGTTAKSTLSTASSNIGALGLQDGTWSSGRSTLADGWPDQPSGAVGGGEPDNKDWDPSQDNAAFSDLVPEFEPGKPWKGAQLKIDEDPSITPGSVARSPLSIATAKEADLFGGGAGKVSPSDAMGLGASAWGKPGKNVWPDSITSSGAGGGGGGGSGSDLWGTPMGKPTRGPPPGLGANKNANGWAGGAGGGPQRSNSGGNWPGGNGWGSSWLLLKNLTSQIDGATLRTLCMQHGPLQSLQLYPNHGLALCKYSSREEASKAQQALNNCPLGSTNIGAECPSEADAQTYLQQLGAPAGSSGSILPPSSSGPVTSVAQSWRQAPRTSGNQTAKFISIFPSILNAFPIFQQVRTRGAPDGHRPVELVQPAEAEAAAADCGHRSRETPQALLPI